MSAFKLVIVSLVLGAIGAVAVLVTPSWFPVGASVQAGRQDLLYEVLMVISAFIMAIVVVFLVYSMIAFRARPGDERDGPPIHGHTGLEIVWTLIPTAIVMGLAVYAAVVLHRNETVSKDRLVVDVNARQFVWSFGYPEDGVKYSNVLELPKGRAVEFHIRAQPNDVIHSFYVPEFRVQANAVPGLLVKTYATPTRTGTFRLICLELCGAGHSQMRSVVRVVQPSQFQGWLAQQRKAPPVNPLGGMS